MREGCTRKDPCMKMVVGLECFLPQFPQPATVSQPEFLIGDDAIGAVGQTAATHALDESLWTTKKVGDRNNSPIQ